ncbi:hypothetical protein PN499_22070 [Kamptonema animale CS-326]|jgi:hypothetical protein|uniref:hypothetical protein n=1 Tax=Kamptonema animale TaxID=92934 RepID=UPI00232E13D2|nr:hypothetical protein [Kamptonema animale]MDB9513890.1 hypothetical protein [Kamptonema animale CS-326]
MTDLQNQITGETWLNKDFLKIHYSIFSAINNGEAWFNSLPPVRAIMSNPAMMILADIIASIKNLSATVKDCGLILCETAYGINKAVNSRVHKDLAAVGNRMLSSLSSPQESLYKSVIVAHNETLNLPELSKMQLSGIPGIGGSPIAELDEMVESNLNHLNNLKDNLIQQIAELTGAAKAKAQRALTKIKSIIDKIIGKSFSKGVAQLKSSSPLREKGPIAIIPIGTATVAGTIAIVSAITSFLLGIFTAGTLPGVMFEALVKATTSVALKFIGSSGAIAARYFAASVFKAAIKSLPAIIGKTGTFAGSWAFLMVFAPFILLAAVITGEAVKNKIKLGELLYIFGLTKFQTIPDTGFVILSRTNRLEMQDEMINMGKSMIDESGKDYQTLIGISINRKLEPVLAVDMKKIDLPVRYAKKEDILRVSAPYMDRIIDSMDDSKPPY